VAKLLYRVCNPASLRGAMNSGGNVTPARGHPVCLGTLRLDKGKIEEKNHPAIATSFRDESANKAATS